MFLKAKSAVVIQELDEEGVSQLVLDCKATIQQSIPPQRVELTKNHVAVRDIRLPEESSLPSRSVIKKSKKKKEKAEKPKKSKKGEKRELEMSADVTLVQGLKSTRDSNPSTSGPSSKKAKYK